MNEQTKHPFQQPSTDGSRKPNERMLKKVRSELFI